MAVLSARVLGSRSCFLLCFWLARSSPRNPRTCSAISSRLLWFTRPAIGLPRPHYSNHVSLLSVTNCLVADAQLSRRPSSDHRTYIYFLDLVFALKLGFSGSWRGDEVFAQLRQVYIIRRHRRYPQGHEAFAQRKSRTCRE